MITNVVYHGTVNTFALCDMRKKAFFTSNIDIAAWFMRHNPLTLGSYPRIISARIKAEKVYEIDWQYESWGGGFFPSDDELFEEFVQFAADGEDEEIDYWEENGFAVDMFASMMEEKGYDLVICRNVREENGMVGDIYVALENAKLISASA